MLLLLSYYCYCSLTTATTLYYTPFLSFACFAVQLLLPNYYYSAFLYLLLCYVSISLFSGSTELLFSGYSSMLRAAFGVDLKQPKDLAQGQVGACYACSLPLCCCLVLAVPALSIFGACCACSTLCVFLGYFSDHKGFQGLDLSSNRVIVARHVTFDETSFPFAKSRSPPPTDDFDFLVEFEPQVRLIGLCVASGRTSHNHGCTSFCPHHASPSVYIPWARYITQVYTLVANLLPSSAPPLCYPPLLYFCHLSYPLCLGSSSCFFLHLFLSMFVKQLFLFLPNLPSPLFCQ